MATVAWNWDTFQGSKVGLRLLKRDLPGLETVLRYVPGRQVAVQAGGNLGLWPKRLAQEFGTVYTFEPDPDWFALLKQNAPEPNIIAEQVALTADGAPVALSRERRDDSRRNGAHEGLTHVIGPGSIPSRRLDSLGLPVCDLLCLDVEGYELRVLQGAIGTLARCRPVLALEINKNLRHVGLTEEFVVRFLHAHGYQRKILSPAEQATLYSDQLFLPVERA
jgi:FkbM family methyltransferase